MFNTPVLDLVILLSFTYFIGSLILAAINEAISGAFRLRQIDLRKGLYTFFFDSDWRNFVNGKLLKSPHIQCLMKKENQMPAYIPARNFILSLVEHLDGNFYERGDLHRIQSANKKPILPDNVWRVMEGIMKQVSYLEPEERMKEFELRLEDFYNGVMDRVTGWYKKRVRRILLITAFVLSIALNIDTIKIVNDALSDPNKLSKTVDNIAANLSKLDSLQGRISVKDDTLNLSVVKIAANAQNNVKQLTVIYEQTSNYSIGYRDIKDFRKQWGADFWKKLLGVLITAFALQLGSNYWFDLMNKAVNIRAAGKKPDEKKEITK